MDIKIKLKNAIGFELFAVLSIVLPFAIISPKSNSKKT